MVHSKGSTGRNRITVMQNLADKFIKTSQTCPDKIAIRYKKDDKWIFISYAALRRRVEGLAAFLRQEGVKKGERVAILAENRPAWPVVFFSTLSLGAVAVPISSLSTGEEAENILKNSECRLIFTDDRSFKLVEEVSQRCLSIHKVVSVDSDMFKGREEGEAAPVECEEIENDDLACILYTSGTTAESKGVMLTHGNFAANCASQSDLNLITPKDSVVSVLPLHHAFPLTATLLFPLLYGGTIVYPGSMRAEALLEAVREAKTSVFVAVPEVYYSFHKKINEVIKKVPFPLNILVNTAIKALYNLREKTGINLSRYFLYAVHRKFGSSMRFFVSGGAKLDEDVERGLFKFGFTILEGYGLTETSPVLTINPLAKPKIGSVGPAIPDVELEIKGKNKEGIGEVVARGANVMKGYYKRDDLTDAVIKDGWFYTGDLGYIDEEGYLFLTGRAKEVIVLSSGVNIYPEEVEEAYSKDAPVKEMCVFEVPSKREVRESSVLWAIVVPDLEFFKKYGEVNLKAVIKERFDNVSRTLPSHMRLMGFSITLEDLPRTLLGKVKRFAVKEIYVPKVTEEDQPSPTKELSEEDASLMEKELSRKIIDYLKKQTNVEKDIIPQDLLELDLGIDSLGRIELAAGLEALFGVEIKDKIIGEAFNVRDLIRGVEPVVGSIGEVSLASGEKTVFTPQKWKETLDVPPKKENLEKIDLNPGFIAWLGCFIFLCMHLMFFKIFSRFKVEGAENLPKEGPYILYVNHTSYFDGLLMGTAMPRFPNLNLFFVGFRPYFDVVIIRNLVKIGRIIPLDFSSHLLESLRSSYYVLKNGKSLCLFPEGLRTLDGNIGEFKKGFGILVKEANVKIVPAVIDGAYESWPRTSKFPKRHPIKVRFGKALTPKSIEEEGARMGGRDSYEAICIGAREELVALKSNTTVN